MVKSKKSRRNSKKTEIFLRNFHPSIRSPINRYEVMKIAKKVMSGEDCGSYYLEINLLENRKIKKINKKFLNHNYYTDVITFSYANGLPEIDAEILISLDEVRKNSLFYGNSFKDEFMRVIIHGCLHLAGYNDITKKQKELIRTKENFYLSKLGKRKG